MGLRVGKGGKGPQPGFGKEKKNKKSAFASGSVGLSAGALGKKKMGGQGARTALGSWGKDTGLASGNLTKKKRRRSGVCPESA